MLENLKKKKIEVLKKKNSISRVKLQRESFWIETNLLTIYSWDFLCRAQLKSGIIENRNVDESLMPSLTIRTTDIRGYNDMNLVKAGCAIEGLGPTDLKFATFTNFSSPTFTSAKVRKLGTTNSSVYFYRRSFKKLYDYLRFIGYFLGTLIPYIMKRQIYFTYNSLASDFSITHWRATDLPQILTTNFLNLPYDYYEWNASTLEFTFVSPVVDDTKIIIESELFLWTFLKII